MGEYARGEKPKVVFPAAVEEGRAELKELHASGDLPPTIEPGTPEHDKLFEDAPAGRPLPALEAPETPDAPRAKATDRLLADPSCHLVQYCATYASSFNVSPRPTYASTGRETVTVTNAGTASWPAGSVSIGYHLYKSDGTVYNLYGTLTPLTAFGAGQSRVVSAGIERLPAGSYKLVWDLYRTAAPSGWFTDNGVPASTAETFSLDYVPPTGQLTDPMVSNATIGTLTPTVAAAVFHEGTKPIMVRFEVCDDESGQCRTSGYISAPYFGDFTGVASWTLPTGYVHWNKKYRLRFQIKDGTTERPWGPETPETPEDRFYFITAVPQEVNARLGSDPSYLDEQDVNLYLSQFVKSESDLTLPGTAGPLTMQRTYNSADTANRAFGTGWSSLLDSSWAQSADGQFITVRLPDGRSHSYGYDPSGIGSWAGGFGEPVNPQIDPGTRRITVDGVRYGFDLTTGRLDLLQYGLHRVFTLSINPSTSQAQWIQEVSSGRRIYLTWSGGHVATESTQPNGAGLVWRYTYTGNQLTKVCDARGTTYCSTYEYTGTGGRLGKVTPPGGKNWVIVAYNGTGQVNAVSRPDGAWSYTRYLPSPTTTREALRIRVDDPRGWHWYSYDDRGALMYRWDTARDFEHQVAYVYDLNGQLRAQIDQNNNSTEYRYDPIVGKTTLVLRWRDGATLNSTRFDYVRPAQSGANGFHVGLLSKTTVAGATCTAAPGTDPAEDCSVEHNRSTTYEYSHWGLLLTQTAPAGTNGTAVTSYVYTCTNDDSDGNPPMPVNDPAAGPDDRQPCELLSSVTDPAGKVTRYAYNHYGDLTRVTTPGGKVTDTFYDANGRVTSQKLSSPQNPAGATTTFTYDGVGHLLTETGPALENPVSGRSNQLKTTHSYNSSGTLATTGETAYVDGQPSERRVTNYTYDDRNREIKIAVDGGAEQTTTYNAFGQPTSKLKGLEEHHYTYWPQGQLKAETTWVCSEPWNPEASPHEVTVRSMTYDNAGRLATSVDEKNTATYYTYTADDLLHEEYQLDGQRHLTRHLYEYDEGGNIIADTVGSGPDARRTVMQYDDANARTDVTVDPNGLNRRTSYTYDDGGRVAGGSVTDGSRTESVTQSYGTAGQVVKQSVENGATDLVTQLGHDADGNVTSVTDPRGTAPIGTGTAPDPAYTTTRTFDELGRIGSQLEAPALAEEGTGSAASTQRATTKYGYNAFGDLTEVQKPNGAVTAYGYDAAGRRVTETVPAPAGTTYGDTIADSSPTHWWTLDDTGATADDHVGSKDGSYLNSGAGRTLVAGAAAYDPTKASAFSASAAGLSVPNATSLIDSNSSLSLWFRLPDQVSGGLDQVLLSYGSQLTVTALPESAGRVWLYITGSRGISVIPVPSDPERWHQLTLTFRSNQTAYYVDGTAAGSATPSSSHTPVATLNIGSKGTSATSWEGAIQHVATYDRLLDPAMLYGLADPAAGAVTRHVYDASDDLIAVIDPAGNRTDITNDYWGRAIRFDHPAVQPGGNPTSEFIYYNLDGQVGTTVDETGAAINNMYDIFGRLETRIQLEYTPIRKNFITTYTYDDFGNRLTQTDDDTGLTTTWTYNKAGEQLTETVPGHGTTTWTRDLAGRVKTERAPPPLSTITTYTYDLAGRATTQTTASADGTLTQSTGQDYDRAGNPTVYTDGRDNEWTTEYDARNRPTRMVDPDTTDGVTPVMTYGYDVDGNQTRVTDGNGNVTRTVFDDADRPTSRTFPETSDHSAAAERTWTAKYDVRGLPVRQSAPNGAVVQSSYDSRGQLTQQTGTGAGVNAQRTFTYSLTGRLASVNEPGGTAYFGYNSRGLLASSSHHGPSGNAVYDSYDYDGLGRPTTATDAAGTTTYSYNLANLASVTDSLSGTTHVYGYDAAGRRTLETDSAGGTAGAVQRWTFDPLGRPATQVVAGPTGAETGKVAYQWDLDNNLTSQTGTGELDSAHSDLEFTYDDADRLTSSYDVNSDAGEDYEWDAAGNRTQLTPWTGSPADKTHGEETTFSYDERNALESMHEPEADTDYTYDAAGNRTRTVRTPDTGSPTTVTSTYDAFGRMLTDSSSGTGAYAYDGLDRLVGSSGGGTLVYGGAGREPVAGPGGWAVSRMPDGSPLSQRASSTATPTGVLTSVHGDLLAMINQTTGTLGSTRTYGPFGATTGESGAAAPIGWQGSLVDTSSDKVHAGARWYDPTAGQFMSQDTAPGTPFSAASANLYGYGAANPTSYNDLNGHFVEEIGEVVLRGATAVAKGGGKYVVAGAAGLGLGDVAAAAAVVVVIGGVAYLSYQLYQSGKKPSNDNLWSDLGISTPLAQPTPATLVPTTTAPAPQTVQHPQPVQQVVPEPAPTKTKVRSKPVVTKDRTRWFDDQNVYISVTTTVTTYVTTILTYADGSTQESVKPETRTRTRHREIPLIDLAHAVAATVNQAIAPILPASGATAPDDGTCGNGGSLATCIQEPDQPPTPGTPTTPGPAPQPGNAGAGGPVPPSSGLSSDHCDPDDPDANSGYNNALRGPDGRFANNPNSARSNSTPSSTHGNSRASDAFTWLYRLEDRAGNLVKWGITSNLNGRYPSSFLSDMRMNPVTGGARDQMLNLERWIVERDPGPENCEPWAGDFQ